jgi:DHA2 family methylenomycin A resistance protein-like MFS transporter
LMALFAASLGGLIVFLDVSAVNLATSAINRDLGGSLAALEWVVNGYTLAFSAFLLTAGGLGDRFGAARVFAIGVSAFAAASLVCAVSPNLTCLIAGRIVQGVAGAMVLPAALSMLHAAYPDVTARTKAVGTWAATASLALALGPVLSGVMVSAVGWRYIFVLNVPVAAVAVWAASGPRKAHTAPGSRGKARLDVRGQVLAVIAVATLTTAIIQANESAALALIPICAVVSVAAFGAFVWVEHRSAAPMLPLAVFRSAPFDLACLIGMLINFAFYGLLFIYSLYFQRSWHYSALSAGLAFLPISVATGISNFMGSRLDARWGSRTVLIIGNVLGTGGYVALVPFTHVHSYAAIIGQFVFIGLGMGLLVPAATTTVLHAADADKVGVASGTFNALRQLGGLLGIAVMSLIVGSSSASSLTAGLRACLICAGAAYFISLILTLVGVRNRVQNVTDLHPAGGRS